MNRNTPWRTTRGSRILALSQGQNDWYRIKNLADGPAQLHIYDEIGFFGVSSNDLVADLQNIEGPIDLHINSPGGEVCEGLAIYNCLMAREGVTVYVDGMAASIASVVAMAGDHIKIAPTAQMMVHNAFAMAVGDAEDLRAMADRLDENTQNISRIYAGRAGQTPEYWIDIMSKTGWYRGQEAVDAGLADEVVEQRSKAAAKTFDMSVYRHNSVSNASTRASADPKNAAMHPYHGEFGHSHEPLTGRHSHNHAAFGASDGDDGIHHHDHTHNNDSIHDHTHIQHAHGHRHNGDSSHRHAHDEGQDHYGQVAHQHTHHDPDHDGDNDGTATGDRDNDYWAAPVRNSVDEEERSIIRMHLDLHNASFDDTPWDGPAAMSAAAKSDSPASALNAICAGKRKGDPTTEAAHALPHHKHPGSPPNKAGVTAALGRLNQTQGLTNKSAAKAHLDAHARAWESNSKGETSSSDWTDEEILNISNTLRGVQ